MPAPLLNMDSFAGWRKGQPGFILFASCIGVGRSGSVACRVQAVASTRFRKASMSATSSGQTLCGIGYWCQSTR